MGLFDKIFSSTPSQVSYSPSNQQEATIAIMYACMAVDGNVSEAEIDKLVQLAAFKKQFKNHSLVDYYKGVFKVHKSLGSKKIIESSVPKIKDDFKPTLFAMIMELVLADGILDEKEKEISEFLAVVLKLDENLASKIVEVILIKNEGNIEIID